MMGCFLRGYELVLADLKFGLARRQRRALDPRTPHATAACGHLQLYENWAWGAYIVPLPKP